MVCVMVLSTGTPFRGTQVTRGWGLQARLPVGGRANKGVTGRDSGVMETMPLNQCLAGTPCEPTGLICKVWQSWSRVSGHCNRMCITISQNVSVGNATLVVSEHVCL
jgi:hypothetical protein